MAGGGDSWLGQWSRVVLRGGDRYGITGGMEDGVEVREEMRKEREDFIIVIFLLFRFKMVLL